MVANKILKNQAGLSFVELMVSAVILGVVAGGVFSITNIQNRSMTGLRGHSDINNMVSMINGTLKTASSCEKNLINPPRRVDADGVVDPEESLTELIDEADEVLVRAGEEFGTGVYQVKEMHIGKRDPISGGVYFHVNFEKVKEASGAQEYMHKILFFPTTAMVDGQEEIVDCKFNATVKAQSILQKFCNDTDPNFDPADPASEGKCDYRALVESAERKLCGDDTPWLEWDEVAKKCRVIDSAFSCDSLSGLFLRGYTPGGSKLCWNPPEPVYPEPGITTNHGSLPPADMQVDGQCDEDIDGSISDGIDINYCTKGTLTSATRSGMTLNWICEGLNGGANANCSLTYNGPTENGRCDPVVNGRVIPNGDVSNCLVGRKVMLNSGDPNILAWSCQGVRGGGHATCAVFRN